MSQRLWTKQGYMSMIAPTTMCGSRVSRFAVHEQHEADAAHQRRE